MGQRHALMVWLMGGGLMVPLIALAILAAVLGSNAVPVALATAAVGTACLGTAKWRLIRNGELFSFGPRMLNSRERRLYWLGYACVLCGLILAVISLGFGFP